MFGQPRLVRTEKVACGMFLQKFIKAVQAYPAWGWLFAALCVMMPIILGVTAVSLILAFIGVIGCLGTSVNPALSLRRRVLLCVFMSVSVWLIFFLLGSIIFALL